MKFIQAKQLILLPLLLFISCEKKQEAFTKLDNLHEFDLKGAKPLAFIEDSNLHVGSYASTNNIGDVAVDESGKIYLVNVFKKRMEVYDPCKSSLIPISKFGKGPQVLQNPKTITIYNGRLYVYDQNLYRMYSFSLEDYELINATELDPPKALFQANSNQQVLPYSIDVMNDGNYLVAYQIVNAPDDRVLYYYRMNPAGQIVSDQLFEHKNKSLYVDKNPNKSVYMMMPYEREVVMATDSKGNIYVMNTETLLIKIFDSDGAYLKAYHYPFENKRLLETDVLSLFTNVDERRAVRGANLPGTWPAAAHMLIDDEDRLWIATITQDPEKFTWYILKPTGEVIGTINLSRQKELMEVKNGHAYLKSFNRQKYSDVVKKYKIDF